MMRRLTTGLREPRLRLGAPFSKAICRKNATAHGTAPTLPGIGVCRRVVSAGCTAAPGEWALALLQIRTWAARRLDVQAANGPQYNP